MIKISFIAKVLKFKFHFFCLVLILNLFFEFLIQRLVSLLELLILFL